MIGEQLSTLVAGLGLGRRYVAPVEDGMAVVVTDTVARPADGDDAADVVDVLRALTDWTPQTFTATVRTGGGLTADAEVRFPSPRPQGEPACDAVLLDWHAARDPAGARVEAGGGAPSVLVLDILHGENMVSAFVGRVLSACGVNAFVMHMPRNARRRPAPGPYDWRHFLPSLRQAIADARRARDVIAALPGITGPVAIQGTSLGGFVTAAAAGIDRAFDPVVIALAGGDVYRVLCDGQVDAARVRLRLTEAGLTDEQLRGELWASDPLRVAHRLDPARTWMFTARRDQVVPAAQSDALAARIGLGPSHHVKIGGCHYTCVVNAPKVIADVARIIKGEEGAVS